MADIRIRVDDHDAERRIRQLALFLADLRPFWPGVARLARGWLKLQFESEGAFFSLGSKWAPLSPRYSARKRILWGDRPILVASGQAKRAASDPRRVATPNSLTLIIDDAGTEHGPVLQYHQEGDGVPQRQVWGDRLPPLAELELAREADSYIRDLLGRF